MTSVPPTALCSGSYPASAGGMTESCCGHRHAQRQVRTHTQAQTHRENAKQFPLCTGATLTVSFINIRNCHARQ